MNVYTVKDMATNTFTPPFCAAHDVVAIRMFKDACADRNNPGNMLARYPKEHVLMKVGTWSEHTGVLAGEHPQLITTGDSALKYGDSDGSTEQSNG